MCYPEAVLAEPVGGTNSLQCLLPAFAVHAGKQRGNIASTHALVPLQCRVVALREPACSQAEVLVHVRVVGTPLGVSVATTHANVAGPDLAVLVLMQIACVLPLANAAPVQLIAVPVS